MSYTSILRMPTLLLARYLAALNSRHTWLAFNDQHCVLLAWLERGLLCGQDQPVHSLDMITRFTRGKKFDTDTVRPIVSRPAVAGWDKS